MGCEFLILTKERGVSCLVNNWPVIGPLVITKDEYTDLVDEFGSEAVDAVIGKALESTEPFFVFKNLNDNHQPPIVFNSLAEVAEHFVQEYASWQDETWESMPDEELNEWCEHLEQWSETGSPGLPTLNSKEHLIWLLSAI